MIIKKKVKQIIENNITFQKERRSRNKTQQKMKRNKN